MSVFLVLGMYALWSTCFSLGKMALEISPPLFLTASRMLFAGLLITGFLLIKDKTSLKVTWKQIFLITLLGFFGMYLTNALEFWSLQHLTAAKTCFIYSLCPFFSALFSYIHFKEKMNGKKWLGLCIGVGGVAPVLFAQKGSGEFLTTIPFLSWPEIAMLGAAISTVYGWILMRQVLKDSDLSPLTTNGLAMLIGGAMALVHSFFQESWNPVPVPLSQMSNFAVAISWMTLISNIICFNLYGLMLKKFTATFLSFMGLLSPIFASLAGWFLLNEELSPIIFFSTAVVSIGAWFVHSAELKQGYIVRKTPRDLLS